MVAELLFLEPILEQIISLCRTQQTLPAMAGTDLFTHIRYMTLTVPTYIITLIIFIFLGLSVEINGNVNQL
jgi:NhaC family Na+:H+ antiporter